MTEKCIKEFKKDLICYDFSYWETEEENATYQDVDSLICDNGKIIYSNNCLETSCAGILFDSIEEFLKTPVREIRDKMFMFRYYNSIHNEYEICGEVGV